MAEQLPGEAKRTGEDGEGYAVDSAMKSDDADAKVGEEQAGERDTTPGVNEGPSVAVDIEDVSSEPAAAASTGLGLNDVELKPSGSIEHTLENTVSLLPPPSLSPHPADDLHAPDSPTTSLISVLREQLRLLSDQSQQLNTKLVASISRHADLLDAHDSLQAEHAELATRSQGLERDKRQWEESMKTGLLVERSQITLEMQKLASGLVEEERRRGSAEQRRMKVEEEVDELAASLFDQANTMVAQERHGRIEAETRLKSTEENLAAAEAAMRDMQVHLQSMPTHSTPPSGDQAGVRALVTRRYLSSHVPYTEYISFLAHLRSLRPLRETSKIVFPPPLLSALLGQPFLARTIVEDHDPTLRLDAAPDLSWLSRRGVSSAIVSGDLIIEPVPATSVIQASSAPAYDIGCALCGKPVFPDLVPQSPVNATHFGPPPQHPGRTNSSGGRFSLKPFFGTAPSPSTAPSPTSSPLASPAPGGSGAAQPHGQSQMGSAALPAVYVFRVVKPVNVPGEKEEKAKAYPLCRSGWCLERLRATCALWHFVKAGLVAVVWAGDDGYVLPSEGETRGGAATAVAAAPSVASITGATPRQSEEGRELQDVQVAEGETVRRKSGWGLGFRGWKSGAGGGTSTTGSVSSPPVSPRLPQAGERVVSASSSLEAQKLGAPLELDSEPKESGAGGPPPLPPRKSVEQEVSEAAGEEETGTKAKDADDATEAEATLQVPGESRASGESQRPGLSRQTSDISFTSAHETFGTASPQNSAPQTTVLPPSEALADVDNAGVSVSLDGQREDGETEKGENATDKQQVIDLSSPVAPTASGVPDVVADAATEDNGEVKPMPPPIPRRAPGRPQSIRVDGSPLPSGRASPVVPEKEQLSASEEAHPTAEGAVDGEDGGAVGPAEVPIKEAPPLPARPPKTPVMLKDIGTGGAGVGRVDGVKAFLPDSASVRGAGTGDADQEETGSQEESWEVKTWKHVVKLKEEMWRARVGVVDGDE